MIKIKEERLKRNMTQDDLSLCLGITTRTYQYIEYGARNPSLEVALKLQELFQCDIKNLLKQ